MSGKWEGGLPPVGATNKDFVLTAYISLAQNPDVYCEVVSHIYGKAVVVVRRPDGILSSHIVKGRHFRPIRTAEEVAVEAMISVAKKSMGRFAEENRGDYTRIYRAICDGKIPGVKLED